MPKVAVLQESFSTGEVAPSFYGRPGIPRYKQGLKTLQNYLGTLQGPVIRRPGTKYANNVKNSSQPPILIPFKYSSVQTYMLEFGDQYIRFYANNGQAVFSQNAYQVTGTYVSQAGGANSYLRFNATRANLNPLQGERLITNTGVLSGDILELPTPYRYADDLTKLRWVQNADTIYIFHPLYPVKKLQRYGADYWTLRDVYFQDGPYLPLNSYATVGDNTTTTLTLIQLSKAAGKVVTGPSYAISGAITDPSGSGQIYLTVTGHTFMSGQRLYVSSLTGTVEANNYDSITNPGATDKEWVITVVDANHILLLGSVFVNAYISGGTAQPALFPFPAVGFPQDQGRTLAAIISGVRFWGNINNLLATNTASASVIYGPDQEFPSGSPTANAWQLGVYRQANSYLNQGVQYPTVGCFHQDRLILAGVQAYPQQIDGSEVGIHESFGLSDPSNSEVRDSDAFQFQLNSSDSNVIRWLKSNAQGLLSGTSASEWVISPSSQSAALTPTNFNAMQSSTYGASDIDAVQLGNAAIYVQRAKKKIREMNYFFQVGTFRSADLTEIGEHITLPSVIKLAVQKDPQPYVWGIRSDGNLISMIYDRNDESLRAGWSRHILGGQSDSGGTNPVVTSFGLIPDPTSAFDQMWLVVKRYLNGSTIYTIEYMTQIYNDSMVQEDAFQFDCGATFYNPKAITVATTANPLVITAVGHGFSNGDTVKIVNVVGFNKTDTNINGLSTTSNLLNEKTFKVSAVTTDTFVPTDFSGNPISSVGYSPYISGGSASRLVTTITGLTWLANETVSILADGGIHPNVVVSNAGAIILQFPAAKVQIGFNYNSDGQMLRIDAGAADGTSIAKTRRTTRAGFMLHNCGDLNIGTSFDRLIPVKFMRADVQQADQPLTLFTGIHREGVESAYDFESQICFRQNSGFPGMINSITSFMEEFDV